MTALTITFAQAKAADACTASYRRMADHVGGITEFGRDTPLPISTLLDVCGLADALWALDAINADRVLRLWSCDCADRVLHLFERERPDDRRPREAIRVSRLFARGLATAAEWAAAWAATWAAAWAATRDAARDAAWAAEWAAARSATRAAAQDAARDAARSAAGAAARAATRSATWDATRSATWAAAWAAEWAAARSAEEAWQVERLRDYLEGRA